MVENYHVNPGLVGCEARGMKEREREEGVGEERVIVKLGESEREEKRKMPRNKD